MVTSLVCQMSAPGALIGPSHQASIWIVAPHKVGPPQKTHPEQAARGLVGHLREVAELSGFL